jgi:hypothetical protein
MALLREIGSEAEAAPWRHWIVALEQIGRVSLPPGARQTLGIGVPVRAFSRDHMLVLHHGGVGATLPIDGRAESSFRHGSGVRSDHQARSWSRPVRWLRRAS